MKLGAQEDSMITFKTGVNWGEEWFEWPAFFQGHPGTTHFPTNTSYHMACRVSENLKKS